MTPCFMNDPHSPQVAAVTLPPLHLGMIWCGCNPLVPTRPQN